MDDKLAKVVALCRRRGFIYQGSEIYGGLSGFYDYGPAGVELKNNIKRLWWQEMVYKHDNIVGLDSAIITAPKVWEASGHVQSFTDPLVECRNCHKRFRADNLPEIDPKNKADWLKKNTNEKDRKYIQTALHQCPECTYPINTEIDEPRNFNLLMSTYLGTVEGNKEQTYLRGETCQGIYLNYKNILDSQWLKVPFGIAQIGKAFRNEITPGNFTFRMREFEQMEMQFFVKNNEQEAQKWFEYWKQERMNWYDQIGIIKEHLRFRDHQPEERAHYARAAVDIEYDSPFGWKEFEGIHHRGEWDLSRHGKYSGADLSYFDEETKTSFVPWIIETSAGADRCVLFTLLDAYNEETENNKTRVYLKLKPNIAPVKAAVFPLMANNDQLVTKATEVYQSLKGNYRVAFDDHGNVGKRYRRQDEIGTPYCFTIDYQTLEDDTVTVRDRDTMKQERISAKEIKSFMEDKIQ